jgi:hypothetical protein
MCNFPAVGVQRTGARNKRQERQGAVCGATTSQETGCLQTWRGKTNQLQQRRPTTCDKSKGAGCDLDRGRRLARNQQRLVDSRTQTLISKQSRRQSAKNMSATLSSLYVLQLVVPVESFCTASSLSIFPTFPRMSLPFQPSASSARKLADLIRHSDHPPAGRCQVQINRKRTGFRPPHANLSNLRLTP